MFRGIYTTLSGMNAAQARLDVATNNLGNVKSKGYKSEQVVNSTFADILISMQSPYKKGLSQVGPTNLGSAVAEVNIDMSQGRLNETGEYTDFALVGDGFYVFRVETADGTEERYGRDSSFHIDSEGFLVNTRGDRLLSQSGPINVGNKKFTVSLDGRLAVEDGEEYILRIEDFADKRMLKKEGEKYFVPTDGAQSKAATDVKVQQGIIEESNVDVTDEMANIIEVLRTYQAGQKLIQAHDELLDKAINQVGKVR